MIKNKFKLTKESKVNSIGIKLFRIKALKDFGCVKKGELGGWIEKESNLSQEGNCWIYGNAEVFENCWIYGDAKIFENAKISGNAEIFGDAKISGYARVCEEQRIVTGYINKKHNSVEYQLASQLGILPFKNKVILYKRVNKISKGKYKSCYIDSFIYQDGKIAEEKDYNKSIKSCSKGIHLSNPFYYNDGDTLISCEVNVKDIITVQQGKVRCKKCKCLGEVKLK